MTITERPIYDGVKCSLILDERYARKDGTHNVNVLLYKDGDYYHHRTGFRFKTWDDASPKAQLNLQKQFDDSYNTVCMLCDQGRFSFDEFKNTINAPKTETLNQLMKDRIEKYKKNNQFSTAGHYSSALNVYTAVLGETPFAQVTSAKMNKLLEYMKTRTTPKPFSPTTINIYFADIRSIVNEAVHKGYIKQVNYPFKQSYYDSDKLELPKSNKRTDSNLTKEEMMKVFKYYEKTHDQYIGLFLFSYLAGGMNLADVVRLKYDQYYFDTKGTELRYNRTKTAEKNDFYIRIAISDKLRSLMPERSIKLNDYVFPYLVGAKTPKEIRTAVVNASNKVNVHLKKMCKKLNFTKAVTPTFARHSFATVMTWESNAPSAFIEYAMGHSNKNISSHYVGQLKTEQMLEYCSYLTA